MGIISYFIKGVGGEAGGRASGGEKKEKGKNERRVIKIMRN